MTRASNKTLFAEYGSSVLLGVLCLSVAALNGAFSGINARGFFMLFAASVCAVLYWRLVKTENGFGGGYIQSGEGAIALLGILIAISFLLPHRLLAVACCLGASLAYGFLMRLFGPGAWGGIFMNLCAIAAGWYVTVSADVSHSFIEGIISGYSRNAAGYPWEGPAYLLLCFALYAAALALRRELRLFAHGQGFFLITGLGYGGLRAAIIAVRAFAVSGIALFVGLLAGTVVIGRSSGIRGEKTAAVELKGFLWVTLFLQAMVFVSSVLGTVPAVILAAAISCAPNFFPRRDYAHD